MREPECIRVLTANTLVRLPEEWKKGAAQEKVAQTERTPVSLRGEPYMRLLALVAILLAAAQALAQTSAQQEELNRITGAPPGTRCFKSAKLAQEMAKHYIGSGKCLQHLRPMDPGRFMKALRALGAIDKDFGNQHCQIQLSLMFRLGREWIAADKELHCAETRTEMSRKLFFRDFVR